MKTKKTSPFPALAGSRLWRENYAFAIGKIRALENFLIKQEVFAQALEADLQEALRLFVESDLYSEELLHIKDSQQLENVLDKELLRLKTLVSDLILDKELIRLLEIDTLKCIEDILKVYPSKFLAEYLRHLIDLHNIKSFLRLYLLKEPQEKLEAVLACEGFMKKEVFLKLYSQDLTILLNRLEYVHEDSRIIDYTNYLGEAIRKAERENSFVALEKASHDFLMQALKPAKYLSFGPEPILAYYFAKVNEMNLIRMIVLAKLNAVPLDLVKERLNTVYA